MEGLALLLVQQSLFPRRTEPRHRAYGGVLGPECRGDTRTSAKRNSEFAADAGSRCHRSSLRCWSGRSLRPQWLSTDAGRTLRRPRRRDLSRPGQRDEAAVPASRRRKVGWGGCGSRPTTADRRRRPCPHCRAARDRRGRRPSRAPFFGILRRHHPQQEHAASLLPRHRAVQRFTTTFLLIGGLGTILKEKSGSRSPHSHRQTA